MDLIRELVREQIKADRSGDYVKLNEINKKLYALRENERQQKQKQREKEQDEARARRIEALLGK